MALSRCANRLLWSAALWLAGSVPAAATGDAPGSIDPALSRAEFSVRVVMVRRLEGQFDYMQGSIRQPTPGRFDVSVRIATQSLAMRNPDHADWARSEEFFDAERYPWIAFEARDLPQALLQEGGELRGLLSLRGTTLPASFELLPALCPRPGLDCPIDVRGELQRSEFGMNARRWAVGDKVRLALSVRLRPDAEPPPA